MPQILMLKLKLLL